MNNARKRRMNVSCGFITPAAFSSQGRLFSISFLESILKCFSLQKEILRSRLFKTIDSIMILSVHFLILTLTGVWCPKYSAKKKIIYKCYSFVVILLMYSLGISQLARIMLIKQNFTEFNDTFFILLSTNFACFKAATILLNQKQVISLLNMFEKDCCIAKDSFERIIQRKYDNFCRKIEMSLLALVEVTAAFVVVAPLYTDMQERELPYKVLLPYNLNSSVIYWLTFVHHTFGAIMFTAISITNDAVIVGFMLQTCSQMDLLTYRLVELPSLVEQSSRGAQSKRVAQTFEKYLMVQNIKHHVHIFKTARTICETFRDVIICQFCISALEISVSVYQLSVRSTNSIELLTYMLYLTCMLGQFFVYCYFGNEVSIRSKNISYTIFAIDWTSLSMESKKNLTIMILRSIKPISMSCGPFVHLTIESFTDIVKASYSVFSVLKPSLQAV